MASYQFAFHPYHRQFERPLKTSRGLWEVREGVILHLTGDGGESYLGEIAPLPWFGSETLAQALGFCRQLPAQISTETLFSIPDDLPACQFGFESAVLFGNNGEILSWIQGKQNAIAPVSDLSKKFPLSHSYLLPTGDAALSVLPEYLSSFNLPQSTFKWKIGAISIETELAMFHQLMRVLPKEAKLRLDANGGLSLTEAERWLQECDRYTQIEFLEQPLPVARFEEMLALEKQYTTAMALDESVANLAQLETCYSSGWRGVFVIKPAIFGSPTRLRKFCQSCQLDLVFSSVFETGIGRSAALQLAAELQNLDRAAGFGVGDWFSDDSIKLILH